jgi:hypothetical protein
MHAEPLSEMSTLAYRRRGQNPPNPIPIRPKQTTRHDKRHQPPPVSHHRMEPNIALLTKRRSPWITAGERKCKYSIPRAISNS